MSSALTFEQAAERVKSLKTRPSNEVLLKLYGLYKQGTVGDNTTTAPWSVQFEAKAKWDAWTANKGTSQDDAKAAYIKLAEELIAKDA